MYNNFTGYKKLHKYLPTILEIKGRLLRVILIWIILCCPCYFFSPQLLAIWLKPFASVTTQFIALAPGEAFFCNLKVAMYSGFILTIPIILWHLNSFLKPALKAAEINLIYVLILYAPLLFLCGGLCAYYLVIPKALNFLTTFDKNITYFAQISTALSFNVHLIIAFGMAFEFPIIAYLLVKLKILSKESLFKNWRKIVLIIGCFSAIITPPDATSMLLLMIPLMALYGISLFMLRWIKI